MIQTSSPPSPPIHPALTEQDFFRLSVANYHEMMDAGILTTDDRVELLDGILVQKMPQHSLHSSTLTRLDYTLKRLAPAEFIVRVQLPISLERSEPEPDVAIVRGDLRSYDQRQPRDEEIRAVIEVSDSTLRKDRETKQIVYARAGIPLYWIINLNERQVEVYTQPSGPAELPSYHHRQDFAAGDSLPLVIDGQQVATLAVAELLP